MSIADNIKSFKSSLPDGVTLIAVSKTKPLEDLQEAYDAGQRIFGENKVQEMVGKQEQLPEDIEWHMIGHMQRNKVKYIAPFVSLIHSVDSERLLEEINKRAQQQKRTISCLLQVHIAQEDTKFGFSLDELTTKVLEEFKQKYPHASIVGLMGMASNTDNDEQVSSEFGELKHLFDRLKNTNPQFDTLSMGMSGDYKLAIAAGSTHIRVGSALFGSRNYTI